MPHLTAPSSNVEKHMPRRRHALLARTLAVLTALAAALAFTLLRVPPPAAASAAPELNASPDSACAACHQAIYDRYKSTPMAQASGPASGALLRGSFTHAPSGIEYRTLLHDDAAWMSYTRPSSATHPALSGERQLLLFVGSGHRGRTYLYQQEGLWFEAPINYYSRKQVWDMAPNFGAATSMPDSLPVDPNCLHCHASAVQPAVPPTRNRYASMPFLQGGIGCAACHGDPAAHLAADGHGPILNPVHLTPTRRDSICLQCHLEGDAAIYTAGRSLAAFQPGQDLAESVTYFVKAVALDGGGRAASQYEALLRSRCKIASGDALTCTTCHDPHGSPPEAERVAYYRARCLTCHTAPVFTSAHHPEQPDCAACHMPTRPTTDISHEQSVDHQIRRLPTAAPGLRLTTLGEPAFRLIPVGPAPPAAANPDRQLGLAYAQAAIQGNREALPQALLTLGKAASAGAADPEFLAQYGLVLQLAGRRATALAAYDRALQADPENSTALANKAVLLAASGRPATALTLLGRVAVDDPSQTSPALNLAWLQCVTGDPARARQTLATLRLFNPDNPTLRTFLETGVYAGQRCSLTAEPSAAAH